MAGWWTVASVLLTLCIKFSAAIAIDCPQGCHCRRPSDKQLTIDCGRNHIDESVFSRELDLLSSADKPRERLTSLQIIGSPLTQVPQSVCRLLDLSSLVLDYNRLTRLPDNCFGNLTSLRSLSARHNYITELQDGIFDGLNSLTQINFDSNQIASIGLRVFSNPSELVSLKRITLDNNRLQSLDPWPYIRGLHGSSYSRVIINIQNNFISNFTNNIRWQLNCSHRSFTYLHVNKNNIRHWSDFLIGWNIAPPMYHIYCFSHDYNHRSPDFRIDFSGSRDYHCDCHDIFVKKYQSFFGDKNVLRGLRCSKPLRLYPKMAYQVPIEEFVCELSDRCPVSCRCVYRPSNATLHIYCSAANLSSLPLDLPPLPRSYDMYKLDLSNNKLLRRLEHRPYFVNTTILDVSNCAISRISLNAWRGVAKMKSFAELNPRVYLHKNNLETLSDDIFEINVTSVRFTLYDNPWKCSCSNRRMIAWFKCLSHAHPNGASVLCASPPRLQYRSIADSSEKDFCETERSTWYYFVVYTLPVLVVVVVLLMAGFAIYRLRIRLYRRWKFHPFDRDECVGEDLSFDVFLCCSTDDNNPHGLRILELMEMKGYRVCYHLRDFLPGELITDSMIQAIQRSKRTVCLVSSNFLKR